MKQLNYFSLILNTDLKEIGVWKQIDVPEKYYEIENNFKIFDYSQSFPNDIPNLKNFRLKTGAKKTGVLSADMIAPSLGLFVSSEFKDIVSTHITSGIKFYPTTILSSKGDKVTHDYNFMFLIDDYHHKINYDNSKFVDFTEDDKEVQLTEEEKKDFPGFYEPKEIVLTTKIDLFRAPYSTEILVSEDLKKHLNDNNITGIEFEEFDKTKFFLEE